MLFLFWQSLKPRTVVGYEVSKLFISQSCLVGKISFHCSEVILIESKRNVFIGPSRLSLVGKIKVANSGSHLSVLFKLPKVYARPWEGNKKPWWHCPLAHLPCHFISHSRPMNDSPSRRTSLSAIFLRHPDIEYRNLKSVRIGSWCVAIPPRRIFHPLTKMFPQHSNTSFLADKKDLFATHKCTVKYRVLNESDTIGNRS